MRSQPQALLWETVFRGKWMLPSAFLAALMLPLLIYGALSGHKMDPTGAREFVALQLGLVMVVVTQLAAGVAFAQGPLSRLFALPISTNSIVAWHVLSGGVFLAIEAAAASGLFNLLFQVRWPVLNIALFALALWSAIQVLMSVVRLQSLLGVALALLPLFFFVSG